jgi:hypothetical protein
MRFLFVQLLQAAHYYTLTNISSTPLRRQQCILKRRYTSGILQDVIFHETAFFLEPEVRTSNLTISQSEVKVSMADEYQHVSTHRNWWYKTSDAVQTLIVTQKNTLKSKRKQGSANLMFNFSIKTSQYRHLDAVNTTLTEFRSLVKTEACSYLR